MNVYQAITAAVRDGAKIRQRYWAPGVYIKWNTENSQMETKMGSPIADIPDPSFYASNWELYVESSSLIDLARIKVAMRTFTRSELIQVCNSMVAEIEYLREILDK